MRQSGGTFLSAEEAGHELQTKTVFPKKEKKRNKKDYACVQG